MFSLSLIENKTNRFEFDKNPEICKVLDNEESSSIINFLDVGDLFSKSDDNDPLLSSDTIYEINSENRSKFGQEEIKDETLADFASLELEPSEAFQGSDESVVSPKFQRRRLRG